MTAALAVAIVAVAVALLGSPPAAAGGLLCDACATWKDPGAACPGCGRT